MITPTNYGYTSPYSQYNNPYSLGNDYTVIGKTDSDDRNGKSTKGLADGECETCENRKYQDGSDEMVSFKSAAHIAPEAAGARVRAHEQEHVSNAYKKAAKEDGQVVRASVSIHTSTCPECGRSYVSGGTTTTAIKYNADPYAQNAKNYDKSQLEGKNISLSA